MKSTIDWNEIVPMLPKALRETLLLEAVSILSDTPRKRVGHKMVANDAIYRLWRDTPEGARGERLAMEGRHYRINKEAPNKFRPDGKIGKAWNLLVQSKNDHITFEGLASIAKGQKLHGTGIITQLWATGHIDVMEKRPVAYAE